jgi:uncharacterized protein (TIGR02300 family)
VDRSDWGVKRVCLNCSARFYDFCKSPMACPACGAAFDPEYFIKRKTKNVQEKNEEIVEDIDIADDDLIDGTEDDADDADDADGEVVVDEDAKN